MAQRVKLSGRDWKTFIESKDVWGETTYWDDTLIFVNGAQVDDDASDVADDAVVEVESGYLVDPVAGAPDDLVDCIEWWLAKQTHVSLVVLVEAASVAAVKAAVEKLGGKVVGGSQE